MVQLKKSFNAQLTQPVIDLFCKAAEAGDYAKVAGILEEYGPAIVDLKDSTGWTAIKHAAWDGYKDLVALLLENGADFEVKSITGRTFLMNAAMKGQGEIVALLLEKGAAVDERSPAGTTALVDAVINERKDVVALLLKKDADIGVGDINGNTPLIHAAMYNRKDIAAMLLEKGADIDIKNNDGYTAITLAESRGLHEMAEFLRDCIERRLEEDVRASAGPLRRDIPAPKVIRIPRQR